jgi:hypothetical protein
MATGIMTSGIMMYGTTIGIAEFRDGMTDNMAIRLRILKLLGARLFRPAVARSDRQT